ncbi:hypothetical protein ACS0TY_021491 [Phlomoides rotata]
MLHLLQDEPLQSLQKPTLHSVIPQSSLNQQRLELDFICKHLVEFTRRRNLLCGQSFHARVFKSGLQAIPLLCNQLINFYSKLQLPDCSGKIFHETELESSTTWSSIISSFTRNESPLLGLEYFKRMLRSDVMFVDEFIFPCVTKACGTINAFRLGQSVHCLAVKIGFDGNVFVGSSVIDMYNKCGNLGDARKVFDEMPEKNVVSWSGMIDGYAKLGEDEEALRLFKTVLREGSTVNDFSFPSVIGICGNSTLFELGKQMHALCVKMNYNETSFVGSSLISMYSKNGMIDGAERVFDEVSDKNVGTYNAMLIARAHHADTKRVFELFRRMETAKIKPNSITFVCILYACNHAGLLNEGGHYFRMMKQYGIQPGARHYASMVDLLARAGQLDEAMKFINEMPIQPTESVWTAFLTGCKIHGHTDLASSVADRVFELGQVSSGIYVLLSNIYAAARKHPEAAQMRKMVGDKKWEVGLSWVEEGNRIHTFVSGDREHEISGGIYGKLDELGMAMEHDVERS